VTVKDLISHDLNIVGNTDMDTTTYSLPTPPHSDPDSPASGVLSELENSQTIDEFITANEVQVMIMIMFACTIFFFFFFFFRDS